MKVPEPLRRAWLRSVIAASTAMALAGGSPASAQLPEGYNPPNQEPATTDQLFDQSDLGNVVQSAQTQYHSGMRSLERAATLEEKAAATEDSSKRSKLQKKIAGAYDSASRSFREAISFDPDLLAAYAGLGAALRGLGNNEEALQVHAAALRRSPDDLDNFQGWSESLLALDRLGNATKAYSDFAHSHPDRAEILMTEIKKWLVAKRSEPGSADAADLERLASWIAQQEQGAGG